MKTESIKCDFCHKELVVESSYPARYCLELKALDTNINNSGIVFSIAMYPPIKETVHFCDVSCLGKWITPNPESKEK